MRSNQPGLNLGGLILFGLFLNPFIWFSRFCFTVSTLMLLYFWYSHAAFFFFSLSLLNINQKDRSLGSEQSIALWSMKPYDHIQYTTVTMLEPPAPPSMRRCVECFIWKVYRLQPGQVLAGLRVMSRGRVEDQCATDGGEFFLLPVVFFFLFFFVA